jgi:hypothetical protein
MTRMERIQAHLRELGPRSTRQIVQHFGWRENTGSAIVSHARSYGYIEPHGSIPNGTNSPMTIWRHREQIIRYPSEARVQP